MGLLRIYLALCVVHGHSGVQLRHSPFVGQQLAVYAFFCVSGFLITYTLVKNYNRGSWVRAFYANRTLRILPSYLAVLLTTIVVGYFNLVDIGLGFAGGDPLLAIDNYFLQASFGAKLAIIVSNVTTLFQDSLRNLSFNSNLGAFTASDAGNVIPGMS